MRPSGLPSPEASRQISPSLSDPPASAMVYPGSARPIEPGNTCWPGELPIWAVVSVWPYPSRTVIPHAARTCSITSGLSGSPAATHSRIGTFQEPRSAWISIRHTVGGAQNDPVHRRQVPNRVGDVRVLDQLRPGGGAGGEVEQQGVVRRRRLVEGDVRGEGVRVRVAQPALDRVADRDARPATRYALELAGVDGAGNDVPHVAALHPVGEVGGTQQRRRGDDDGADPGGGEHHLPQLDLVAEHQQQVVSPAYPRRP